MENKSKFKLFTSCIYQILFSRTASKQNKKTHLQTNTHLFLENWKNTFILKSWCFSKNIVRLIFVQNVFNKIHFVNYQADRKINWTRLGMVFRMQRWRCFRVFNNHIIWSKGYIVFSDKRSQTPGVFISPDACICSFYFLDFIIKFFFFG